MFVVILAGLASISVASASDIADYKFHNPEPKDTKAGTATDLHVEVQGNSPKLTIIGIDGMGSRDPKATFTVTGQDTTTPAISNISVPAGHDITIRIESTPGVAKVPPYAAPLRVHWTYTVDGKVLPGTSFEVFPEGSPR